MSPVEIARFLGLTKKNRWSGILLLDGKYIRKGCLLILAVDYVTLDIIAWIVVEAETEENYTKLVDLVEQCGYHIKALISDGHPAITSLTTPKKQFVPKGTRRYPDRELPQRHHYKHDLQVFLISGAVSMQRGNSKHLLQKRQKEQARIMRNYFLLSILFFLQRQLSRQKEYNNNLF